MPALAEGPDEPLPPGGLTLRDHTVASIASWVQHTKPPEAGQALRFDLAAFWSRRIDQEHRLVYRIDGDDLHLLACRYHY